MVKCFPVVIGLKQKLQLGWVPLSKYRFFSILTKFDCGSSCCWDLTLSILFHSLVGKQKAILTSWSNALLLLQNLTKNCNLDGFHYQNIDFCKDVGCYIVGVVDFPTSPSTLFF